MKRFALIASLAAIIILSCSDKGSEPNQPPVMPPPGTPVIDSLSADHGWVGDSLDIYGSNFGGSRGLSSYVKIDTVYTGIIYWTDTKIGICLPEYARTGDITVRGDTLVSRGFHFTVDGIDRIEPDSADVGTEVRIYGAGFKSTQGSSSVKFNVIPADIISWSDGLIVTTVPAGATTGNVTISIDGHISLHKFVVDGTYGITSIEPVWGPWGTEFTIHGFQFGSQEYYDQVIINEGFPCQILSWSDRLIEAVIPRPATSGYIVVRTGTNAAKTNGAYFSVFAITDVTPRKAVTGDAIQIEGSGFGYDQGTAEIRIGGVSPELISWSDTFIVATVPNDAIDGYISIAKDGYTVDYTSFDIVTTPIIDQIEPEWGTYGDTVTIGGSFSGSPSSPPRVTFDGVGGPIISWHEAEIITELPYGCRAGDVIVTIYGVVASNPHPFSVFGIIKLLPGWAAVGDTVDVIGTGFGDEEGANYLTLNGAPVTPIAWSNDTIRIIIPPGTSSGDIAVNIDGKSSNTTAFSLKSEDDILGLLQQANRIDVSFSGWISYNGSKHRSFNMYVNKWGNIDWNERTAHAHETLWNITILTTTDLKGWVSSDGSTIDSMACACTRWDNAGTVAPIILDTYKFRLINVPLNYVEGPDDFKFTYELSGPDVEFHIADIQLLHEVWYHEGGYYSYSYSGTDWDNEAYPPKITITFQKE